VVAADRGRQSDCRQNVHRPQVRQQILRAQSMHGDEPGTVLRDVETLLAFISDNTPTVSTKNHLLPMGSLAPLNAQMTRPIQLGLKRPQQRAYAYLHALYLLLRATGLTSLTGDGNTPRLALDEDGLHQLGVGFQGTYANRTLDGNKLTFEDGLQLDGTWLRSPTEAINYQYISVHYFDMNLGVLYNGSTNGNNNYYFGLSAYHLNKPKESFLGVDTINVPIRVTAHGGAYFPVTGSPSTLYLSGLYNRQAGAHEIVFGGAWAISARVISALLPTGLPPNIDP